MVTDNERHEFQKDLLHRIISDKQEIEIRRVFLLLFRGKSIFGVFRHMWE